MQLLPKSSTRPSPSTTSLLSVTPAQAHKSLITPETAIPA